MSILVFDERIATKKSVPGPGTVSSDSLRDYLQRIGRVVLLSAEDEVELARRIEAGVLAGERLATSVGVQGKPGNVGKQKRELQWLVRDGEVAYNKFICANLRLVVSIAKRYAGRGLPLMDVIQEGNLGLVRAVEKFDYVTGNKFSTYATWWIRQSILRGIADSSRLIRVPVHTVEKLDKLNNVRRDLAVELGRNPTIEEISERSQVPVADIVKLNRAEHGVVSLALPIGEDGDTVLGDLIEDTDIPSPFDAVQMGLRHDDIRRSLDALPVREATVIRLRFGLEGRKALTLDEIGALYGITRERVRQLETRTLRRLRATNLHDYLT